MRQAWSEAGLRGRVRRGWGLDWSHCWDEVEAAEDSDVGGGNLGRLQRKEQWWWIEAKERK